MTLGIKLVRKLAAEGLRVFIVAKARSFVYEVGLFENYFRQALHHLVNSGRLLRLRKGLPALRLEAFAGFVHKGLQAAGPDWAAEGPMRQAVAHTG